MDYIVNQKIICKKYNSPFIESPNYLKVGISLNVKNGIKPLNGLRHHQKGDTSGWYIWAGEEFSDDPNFFVPLHIEHFPEWCPEVIQYLGLAPGWRFLLAPGHVDVWEDKSLLNN